MEYFIRKVQKGKVHLLQQDLVQLQAHTQYLSSIGLLSDFKVHKICSLQAALDNYLLPLQTWDLPSQVPPNEVLF